MKTTTKYLQKYANQVREKYYPQMPRVIVNQAKLKSCVGGMAIGSYKILIPQWMLCDKEQAQSTIRHELAHNIVNHLGLPKVISHGKEFHQILKQIAPRTWRNDLHWYASEAITEARIKAGIKTREHKHMAWRYFGCDNLGCKLHNVKAYAWKRIPSYIQRGLFVKCKYCGSDTLVEIGGRGESFSRIH